MNEEYLMQLCPIEFAVTVCNVCFVDKVIVDLAWLSLTFSQGGRVYHMFTIGSDGNSCSMM